MKATAIKNNTVESKETHNAKVLSGVVVSDKMKDTVVVSVVRFVKHAKYKKYHKVSKRYQAHDLGNQKKVGDKVSIKECRPISKNKHFMVV